MWTPTLTWLDNPVLLVVYALAVYRLTVLVTADFITERPRRWVMSRGDTWATFITCPWCTSVWLAAGWIVLASLVPTVAGVLGVLLALSAVAGYLSEKA